MKTIKELEADLKVAIAINNVEWIIQLEAKLQHTKDVLGLIDEMNENEHLSQGKFVKELKSRITG